MKQAAGSTTAPLADWLPTIVPTLRTLWVEQIPETSQRPYPALTDWLTLLHVTETATAKIDAQLVQMLDSPTGGNEIQESWIILTKLFDLTFEAMRHHNDEIPPIAWPSLLDLQNKIIQSAATKTLLRQNRPSTDILTRRANYLDTITELNKHIVASQDTAELLDQIVSLIQKNFAYEYVGLYSLNQSQQALKLRSASWHTYQDQVAKMPILAISPTTLSGRAASTRQMVLSNDLSTEKDIRPHPILYQALAQISVPLLTDDQLLGVLEIVSDRTEAFTDDDCQILLGLANHIAAVVKNVRLQNTLQRHLREQTLLYESNVALGTSLDVDTVLQLVSEVLVEIIAAGACVISEIDLKQKSITAHTEHILDMSKPPTSTWRKIGMPLPLKEDPLVQQVLQTQRPVTNRASKEKPAPWQCFNEVDESQWGTVLALPFEIKKEAVGLIEIYDRNQHRDFSADDIHLGQLMATQATLALGRARLFDDTRDRLNQVSTLYTMAQKIAGNLDLQAVLDDIVVALRQVIGCRGCCIFLLDQSNEKLEIRAADGLKSHWRDIAKLRVGEGAAGTAVSEGKTVYIPDIRQAPDSIIFDESVQSLMVTPMWASGEIIGTINVDDVKPDAFGPAQEQLLNIAATQVGIAIENARLFSKISTERQQMQAIIQNMADGLLVTDKEGSVITCNPALAMMLGLSIPNILQKTPITAPTALKQILDIKPIRGQTGMLTREVTIETIPPKTLQVYSTRMEVGDELIGEVRVVHDVTKERDLDQLKSDFMSTISHELRTPLFSIQGFVQILLEDDDTLDAELRREFLTTIQTQSVQLSEMVNNLLDMARFDEGRMELVKADVDMAHLLSQTSKKLVGFAHQQNINLYEDIPPVFPIIIGDVERLEQVLTNLIGNAIKFTPEGGQVHIRAKTIEGQIAVEVQDNGIGIPPNDLDQIFSRYYQVSDQNKPSTKGSGLGLHIAKKIVEEHDGKIWAESVVGEGSTFHFTIPIPKERQ